MSGKQLTRQAVVEAVKGQTSMTAVVKSLGYKSVYGATTRKIRELVPDIDDRLGKNKGGSKKPSPKKATPPKTDRKRKSKAEDEAGKLSPFRAGSKYSEIWKILYRERKTGVSRQKVRDELEGKGIGDRKTNYYALTVVASPDETGTRCHRSVAGSAADLYFCRKAPGGAIHLILRNKEY